MTALLEMILLVAMLNALECCNDKYLLKVCFAYVISHQEHKIQIVFNLVNLKTNSSFYSRNFSSICYRIIFSCVCRRRIYLLCLLGCL
jgi:hypothetical protein